MHSKRLTTLLFSSSLAATPAYAQESDIPSQYQGLDEVEQEGASVYDDVLALLNSVDYQSVWDPEAEHLPVVFEVRENKKVHEIWVGGNAEYKPRIVIREEGRKKDREYVVETANTGFELGRYTDLNDFRSELSMSTSQTTWRPAFNLIPKDWISSDHVVMLSMMQFRIDHWEGSVQTVVNPADRLQGSRDVTNVLRVSNIPCWTDPYIYYIRSDGRTITVDMPENDELLSSPGVVFGPTENVAAVLNFLHNQVATHEVNGTCSEEQK